MPRYFLEVAYRGDSFSGFQVQDNVCTVQSEVEQAFRIFFRKEVALTGSSRTDAGVHALQNYFHFDWDQPFDTRQLYNLNSIINRSIVLKSIQEVPAGAHCRFHAVQRQYRYNISRSRNPFKADVSWYFPYQVHTDLLDQMAILVRENKNFIAFSKRHTQVKTFDCQIYHSRWVVTADELQYEVAGNRFLRGMVRGLVSSMLRLARKGGQVDEFAALLSSPRQAAADFAAPAHGLFLERVVFPPGLLSS
jgi:tRNA pseudouridine38-40 synthase